MDKTAILREAGFLSEKAREAKSEAVAAAYNIACALLTVIAAAGEGA